MYFFCKATLFRVQADRGCAVGAIFRGGGTGHFDKGVSYTPRATDFREERNPPQADIIVSVFNR